MRKRAALSVTLVTSLAGVVLLAAPAHAVDTPATIQINAGELSISAPVGTIASTPIDASIAAQSVAFALGDVTVSDAFGGTAGWSASVLITPFVSATGSIPVTDGTYALGAVAQTGVVTVTPTDLATLGAADATVATGTAASGVNTAVWNPTITVPIPESALAGTYTSTVTHSVL
jgi:hypothetical protein